MIYIDLTFQNSLVTVDSRNVATEKSIQRKLTWWRHQMEIFSALLAICAGNSPVTGEFPTQRPVTRSSDVYFDLRPNERLSKQWWGWWFETLSRSLWRHRNEMELTHWDHFKLFRATVCLGWVESQRYMIHLSRFIAVFNIWPRITVHLNSLSSVLRNMFMSTLYGVAHRGMQCSIFDDEGTKPLP